MEEYVITAGGNLPPIMEDIGAAGIGIGGISAAFRDPLTLLRLRKYSNPDIRLYLGRFLALGLEFQVGGDILATAVSPTWEEVQLLAAIVVIRTVLNYFLSKELEREREQASTE